MNCHLLKDHFYAKTQGLKLVRIEIINQSHQTKKQLHDTLNNFFFTT